MATEIGRIGSADRDTRASHQAATRLDHTASVPCAFTPGPWCINPKNEDFISTASGDADIAEVCGWPTKLRNEEQANRHLIAAAPALYRELANAVVLLRAAGVEETENGTIRAAECVLAKARGEHS